MSDDAAQEKSHEPTAKRVKEFRDKGQVPKSQDVLQSFGLAFGGIVVYMAMPMVGRGLGEVMSLCYSRIPAAEMGFAGVAELTGSILVLVAGMLLPVVGILWALMLIVASIQSRGAFPKEPFKVDLQKFNLFTAFQEKFLSTKPLMEAFKAVLKLVLIGGLITAAMWDRRGLFTSLVTLPPGALLKVFQEIVFVILTRALPVAFFIAIVDYAYEWYRLHEKMKMTREEIKEEHKSTEGDPHLRAARKRRALEIAMARTSRNVSKADVVITNPTHYAVALRYRKSEAPAPVVVAMGVEAVALRIRAEATRHDIPQIENRTLARALYAGSKEGKMIPEELYGAVARVLAVILRRRKARGQHLMR